MYYIQRKDSNGLETVDEFTTRKEAKTMLAEYRLSDWSATYYLSSRACKAWLESTVTKDHPMVIQPSEINVAHMLMDH
jgi:hypothetical protein